MGTTLLPPDFKDFLKLLNSRKVRYLLIGGFAESVVDRIDGNDVSIISLKHLKANKKASGRFKDLADLEHLE